MPFDVNTFWLCVQWQLNTLNQLRHATHVNDKSSAANTVPTFRPTTTTKNKFSKFKMVKGLNWTNILIDHQNGMPLEFILRLNGLKLYFQCVVRKTKGQIQPTSRFFIIAFYCHPPVIITQTHIKWNMHFGSAYIGIVSLSFKIDCVSNSTARLRLATATQSMLRQRLQLRLPNESSYILFSYGSWISCVNCNRNKKTHTKTKNWMEMEVNRH